MKQITNNDAGTKSADLIAENLERVKELFPDACAEGALDFDVLKQLLGGTVDEREEKYGLNWHGKRRARQLALTPSTGTLRPSPKDSVNWDTTQHLIVEGDNLEVLKLLQKSYAGKVKLIYIDPPYNNGNDRIYPDDFTDNIRNYLAITGQLDADSVKISSNTESSGRFHTDWLNMLYPRLKLARSLLKPEGVIFISIDEHEVAALRQICFEVFGEENAIGSLVWKGATDNNPTQIAMEHEYVLCFGRSKDAVESVWKNSSDDAKTVLLTAYRRFKESSSDEAVLQRELRAFIKQNREALNGITHYDRVDASGVYTGSRKVHNPKPGGYQFDVVHPITKKVCVPPVNGYRYPPDTLKDLINSDKILYGDDETQIIQIKEYLEDYEGKLSSVINLDSRTGSNEINALFGVQKVFSNPKPVALLKSIFEFVVQPGDTVLDFFAGSGSTGDAVLQLNLADNGDRRFILVQLPEPLDPKDKDQKTGADFCDKLKVPRHIAELTKERLRRAGTKVREVSPIFSGDTGFRVFKLDSSNIRAWEPAPTDVAQQLLDSAEHLKQDRTEQDVLYELLLKLGLDLTVPIEKKSFVSNTAVYSVGAGTLFVCLTQQIKVDDIEALAQGIVQWHKELSPSGESRIVFRDSAFADDVAKTNLTKILEQNGLDNVRSI